MVTYQPIGTVRSSKKAGQEPYPLACRAQVELKPAFTTALRRLEEYSHIWLICHYRRRPAPLPSPPGPKGPEDAAGVLASRSHLHPNPLALSLVKLERVAGNVLYVDHADAYDGTEVLDIKPYLPEDRVFSPLAPPQPLDDPLPRKQMLWQLALNHHQEPCAGAALAVQMALAMEQKGFCLADPQLQLAVEGDPCLADTLQGLCQARLAHPSRFAYQGAAASRCRWTAPQQTVVMTPLGDLPQEAAKILSREAPSLFKTETHPADL